MPLAPGNSRKRGGASFPCPACGKPSHVRWTKREFSEDVEDSYAHPQVWVVRERACLSKKCAERFTTREKLFA